MTVQIMIKTSDSHDKIIDHFQNKWPVMFNNKKRKLNKELLPVNKVKSHYSSYLKKDIESEYRTVIIAISGDEIIGMILGRIYRSLEVTGYEKRASMGNLYVRKKYRGKGVAKKLINTFIKWCKSEKVKTITLSIYKDNKFVQKIYHKIGFKDQFITMHKKL